MKFDYQKVSLCPACRSHSRSRWTRGDKAPQAFRCHRCSMVYLGQRISEKSCQFYYSNYNLARDLKKITLALQRHRMYEMDRDYVELFLKQGKILDVGAGTGAFLSGFPSTYKKFGFDIDSSAVQFGLKKYPNINLSDDWHKVLRNGPFDGIVFRGTLEYQRDLREISTQCQAHLRKGGYLFLLSTTNVDSPVAELTREKWGLYHPVEHLAYFNLPSLERLFSELELKDFRFPYVRTPYENKAQDLRNFLKCCKGKNRSGRFPFWGSILNAVFVKG